MDNKKFLEAVVGFICGEKLPGFTLGPWNEPSCPPTLSYDSHVCSRFFRAEKMTMDDFVNLELPRCSVNQQFSVSNDRLLILFSLLAHGNQLPVDCIHVIIPYLLSILSGGQSESAEAPQRLSLTVAVLSFLLPHYNDADKILGLESNVLQIIRLCLSRGVYPLSSPPASAATIPSPMEEAAICRVSLAQILRLPNIASSNVMSEIVGFMRKWWLRLNANAQGTLASVSTTGGHRAADGAASITGLDPMVVPPLRTALEILVTITNVITTPHSLRIECEERDSRDRFEWLLRGVRSMIGDLPPLFLASLLSSSGIADIKCAYAAAHLLSSLVHLHLRSGGAEAAPWVDAALIAARAVLGALLDTRHASYHHYLAVEPLMFTLAQLIGDCISHQKETGRATTGGAGLEGVGALGSRAMACFLDQQKFDAQVIEREKCSHSQLAANDHVLAWGSAVILRMCIASDDCDSLIGLLKGLPQDVFSSLQDRLLSQPSHIATELNLFLQSTRTYGDMDVTQSPLGKSVHESQSPFMTPGEDSAWSYEAPEASTPDASQQQLGQAFKTSLDTSCCMGETDRVEGTGQDSTVRPLSNEGSPGAAKETTSNQATGHAATINMPLIPPQIPFESRESIKGAASMLLEEVTCLRRTKQQLERILLERDGSLENERRMRSTQESVLEEAWAKLAVLARADADSRHEKIIAEKWASQCQEASLAEGIKCISLQSELSDKYAENGALVAQIQFERTAVGELKNKVGMLEGKLEDHATEIVRLSSLLQDATRQRQEEARQRQDLEMQLDKERVLRETRDKELCEELRKMRASSGVLAGERDDWRARHAAQEIDLAKERAKVESLTTELSGQRALIAYINKWTASAAENPAAAADSSSLKNIRRMSLSLSQPDKENCL